MDVQKNPINLISNRNFYDAWFSLYTFSTFNGVGVNSGGASEGQPEYVLHPGTLGVSSANVGGDIVALGS